MDDLCYDESGFILCPCGESHTCYDYQQHLKGMEYEKSIDDLYNPEDYKAEDDRQPIP